MNKENNLMFPVIGLMSGTSMDGIDATLVYTDGVKIRRTRFNHIIPFSIETMDLLSLASKNQFKFLKNFYLKKKLINLITNEHISIIKEIIIQSKITPKLIGFHGQTILHRPDLGFSTQLGDAKKISNNLKIDVVYNFRKADLLNGGQGAPLAPIYHKCLIDNLNLEKPAVIINIGGIANISYWDNKNLIGFDTGPGNNLMDHAIRSSSNNLYDKDGEIASKGKINYQLVLSYVNDIYYSKNFPKSLDRSDCFKNKVLDDIFQLSLNDKLATLLQITIDTISISFKLLPKIPKSIIVVGGGQNNKYLIKKLSFQLNNKILTGNQINLPGDFIEAELIALLSARKYYNFPSTFLTTTGVKENTVVGEMIKQN